LPITDGSAYRQFQVRKDNGEFWNMNFTGAGVNWERSERPFDEPVQSQGFSPSAGASANSLHAIGSVIDAAASIGMWWEIRQQRLLTEAVTEETRRSAWLAEMVARWGDIHRGGNQLDLRVSEYLAREAREMLDAIVANKRVALPQSMLYELEVIQDTLRSFRSLMLTQFETLSGDTEFDLDRAVGKIMPRRKLDMDFIRSLGGDPSAEWMERVRAKSTGDFDRDLTEALRPDVFLSRVFPRNEVGAPEPQEAEKQQTVLGRLVGIIAPALPRLLAVDSKPDASERRDVFRELSLLPAEVSRVKALNSAWLATSAIVAESLGGDPQVQVQISARGLGVGLASSQSEFELMPLPGPDDV
jgi:hypothetical protein